MRYLVFLLIICFTACGENKDQKEGSNSTDTLKQSTIDTTKKTELTPLSSLKVYSSYIPESVNNYITTSLPDWSLPDPESWDKYWWDYYKKEKTLVNFISGDFNCDHKTDHALILTDKKGNTGAWALLAKDSSYESAKLEQIDKEPGMIGIGLEILEKGKQGDLNGDKPRTVNVKCEGVTIVFFEKAAHSWYWEKGKLKMIQTAD